MISASNRIAQRSINDEEIIEFKTYRRWMLRLAIFAGWELTGEWRRLEVTVRSSTFLIATLKAKVST
ncbi:hypothetical protein AFK24_25780 [Pseudomonas syringae]|uniref:Uncharacterized protein n=1 Tax=Pseudomonas syringae TaxID=317 RepID=A0A1C7Z008_PSESX|nr:hypothetical protein AFK24_25780 [Pseudomonas syringae]